MSNSYFPENLLLDVLSRLPIKTLLRFRCVSKPWRDMIQSRYFTKMHSKLLENNNADSKLIIGGEIFGDLNAMSVKKLRNPPPRFELNSRMKLLGSSNGVLCLHYNYSRVDEKIVLWNPLSRNSWELPSHPIFRNPSSDFVCAYGFGYDKTTDDFKVVQVISFLNKYALDKSIDPWIYSLKLNRWKRLKRIFSLRLWADSVLVNDALHWISTKDSVLAFSLADENFYTVPQPNDLDNFYSLNLGMLEGCLSLSYLSRSDVFVTWIMKDYGIKDSWTRINLKLLTGLNEGLRPIAYSNNEEQVIVKDQNKLIFCDLEKQSAREEQVVEASSSMEIHPYFETLECYDFTSNEIASNI